MHIVATQMRAIVFIIISNNIFIFSVPIAFISCHDYFSIFGRLITMQIVQPNGHKPQPKVDPCLVMRDFTVTVTTVCGKLAL